MRPSTAWPSGSWRRVSARATGSASGRRTAPSGCSSSTRPRRSARSSSTSTPPTAPTSDPKYGEELCAWVVLREGATASEEEIREFCRGQLAHFKVPRYVVFADEFPITVTGKVQKFKMREESIEQLGLGKLAPVETA
jgi:hypothetical protein